jgi:hypothetical protein
LYCNSVYLERLNIYFKIDKFYFWLSAGQLCERNYTREGQRSEEHSQGGQCDPYTIGFQTHPPVSSLLSKITVSSLFQSQYEAYDHVTMETSCARIDHQYIESKLVKGHNETMEHTTKHAENTVRGDSCVDVERNHVTVGKTVRNDVGEETLPDRKRHKSENHREKQELNDRDGRKRHKTTSDACSITSIESETVSSVGSVPDKHGSGHKKHKSSHKHKSKRKDKYSKTSEKEEMSAHRHKSSDDNVRDETLKPSKNITKNVSNVSWRNDAENTEIKNQDKQLKKSEKESILSKLESSMKSFRKNIKEKTEEKKSKTSEKHKKIR